MNEQQAANVNLLVSFPEFNPDNEKALCFPPPSSSSSLLESYKCLELHSLRRDESKEKKIMRNEVVYSFYYGVYVGMREREEGEESWGFLSFFIPFNTCL